MKSLSRRSFLNLFRGPKDEPVEPSPDQTASAAPAPSPRGSFDIRDYYRQREILGVVGESPPPIKLTTEIKVATTNVGSMKRRQ